jgi:iron complex transport system substrate-binding protein
MKFTLQFLAVILCIPFTRVYAEMAPRRIVSCSVAGDEILLQLLTTKEKRKRLLAVSELADNPEYSTVSREAKDIPQRTGTHIEHILSLKSDLIIAASFNQAEFLQKLQSLKLKTHVMEGFRSLEDLKRHILTLGALIGAEKESQEKVKALFEEIAIHRSQNTRHPKVLILMPDRTLLGKDTLLDDVVTQAGYINIAREWGVVGWQKISEEKLLQAHPDWILTSAYERDRTQVLKTLKQSPALKRIKHLDSKLIIIPPAIFSSFSPKILQALMIIPRR